MPRSGFYRFDCSGWPISAIPLGGGTIRIEEIAHAVSGTAGIAVVVAAKLSHDCLAIGG